MALWHLEWDKQAYADLSHLVSDDYPAARTVIALAVDAAEDPDTVGAHPVASTDLYSAARDGWFIVFHLATRFDVLRVVGFGRTA